ncbi:hypothetical protein HYN56_20770 [Flavobacterium crocinum]|uniref:Trimeric autotransporter adhesin YadA-like head domain-containing protein n=1 Tax=Flavobacterium crocinum TaxID=2183896 RepID=A0A2S1YR05_9FLAO|nr:hypothetical protein [Flavobacterium crocinum]AWK06525.1 hypothetical protein HYN56_20770 [Flavobacterium crocinum]
MKNKLLCIFIFLGSFTIYSQVGIGTPVPNASSQLEITATNRGVLIPRISLNSSTDTSTITSGNVNSLLVFNTATVSDIKPGYYYWFDNKWNRIVVSGETTVPAGSVIYNSVNQTFSYIDNSGNSQIIEFSTIVKANETITTQIQNTSTGAITYTNEAGNSTISQVVSANTGNLLKVGSDGGAMLDASAIPVGSTTVSNASTTNTSTITVNGVTSSGAPIINSNEISLTGSSLTTAVNGVSSTALDLTPAVSAGTTNNLSLSGNTLTSNVNGKTATSDAVSGVSNASTGNTATITVNGITSTGAPIVNLNETSLSGTSLTTTVNGVASAALDLSPAITASQIVTNLEQATTTGVITYTNEGGIVQTANVTSANTGNILTVGTDGGSLFTPTSLADATSVSNASTGNTTTVTVNGKTSTGAPIVNLNETSLSGTSLTTTVNGVASTALDLSPAITAGTTNNLSLSGNTLTSNVNGKTATSDAVSGVSNASTGNMATITVNGITSSGAPIVSLNETSLSGTSLTTTVNGVASTALDLSPAITASQIVTNLEQATTTGVITYTNEGGIVQTANVTSANTGNILTVGTDGGSLFTPTSLADATSVSNASTGNTATITVNGKTSTGAPIVNLNETSLSGTSLTTTVNGVASTALDLAPAITAGTTNNLSLSGNTLTSNVNGVSSTSDAVSAVANTSAVNTLTTSVNGIAGTGVDIINSNTLTATNGNLVSTVNGVATTPAVPVLITADNGLTVTNGNVQLTGSLIKPTIITTDVTNTFAFAGLQTGNSTTDNFVVATSTGVLRTVTPATANFWRTTGNGGTDSAVNFLGTTDGQPLMFKINNVKAGMLSQSGTTAFGLRALSNSVGTNNTAFGHNTLTSTASGTGNVAMGYRALEVNTGNFNTAIGVGALLVKTTGNQNIAIGNSALGVLTSGTGNTVLGYQAGMNVTSGNQNIIIGNTVDLFPLTPSTVGNNRLNIGNAIFGTGVNNLSTSAKASKIGINIDTPTNTLHVSPQTIGTDDPVRIDGLRAGIATNNLVVADANGVLKIIAPSDLVTVSSVSNTSTGNILNTKVNNVTGNNVNIINLNETSLSGTSLITTVNGVASTALDLAPAITVSQTVTNLEQATSTGVITYTNEGGTAQTANVTSVNTGNILTVGTDGGSLLTPTSLADATSVSNASTGNTTTVTVNGKTSTGATIINSNTLTATNGNLVSTVNGVATTPVVPVLITADNGLTVTNGNVQLGGSLIKPTTITTDATNTLTISNLQTGGITDDILVADTDGVLKKVSSNLLTNNWSVKGNAGTDSGTNFIGTTDDKSLMFKLNNEVSGMLTTVTDGSNTSFGYYSFANPDIAGGGQSNSAFGTFALQANTTGQVNTAVGKAALQSNTTGVTNTAVGANSISNNLTGIDNTALGVNALYSVAAGNGNTAVGVLSGFDIVGNYNTLLGLNAGHKIAVGNSNIVIGARSTEDLNVSTPVANNELNIGNTLFGTGVNGVTGGTAGRIGVNTNAPTATLDINGEARVRTLPTVVAPTTDNLVTTDSNGNLHQRTVADAVGTIGWLISGNTGTDSAANFLGTTDDQLLIFKVKGTNSGMISTDTKGKTNTSLGYRTLSNWLTTAVVQQGSENTAFGYNALAVGGTVSDNTAIGYAALSKVAGSSFAGNTAVGALALGNANSTTLLGRNTAVGYLSLGDNTSGSYNTGLGASSLNHNLTGGYNTALGNLTLQNNSTGNYNVAIGDSAGIITTTGSSNILIGGGASSININTSAAAISNEMNIGNTLFGTGVNGVAGGTAGRIGVNTNAPTATLDINGAARVRTLPAGLPTDNIVTADASGNLRTISSVSSIAVTMNIVRKTADYTVDPATDNVILIDAASNNVVLTVPSGVAVGRVFTIKRVDSFSANAVTITFAGASAAVNETDTSISVDIRTAYQIITDGSDKWQTISKF